MLYWSLVFFLISLVAGILGLNNVAGLSMDIAKFLIALFLVLAIVSFAIGIWTYKKAKNLLNK
ncbi:hypothetical protein AZI86_01230 [Bdellovibrio bacteriovorus]|uniref:DUF1328 domain-containing protein n=1 Tax=Bdellovibrio bacteriovorus TaxID=959 RepID=A0A150WN43_BDEBC|nr:DUF1328 domain-containing protein [Bdellovibrio bacteriovorus]KYG65727.1 hypothetical protein AZI86_01230 [Bdellovibrio bacteriovorus]